MSGRPATSHGGHIKKIVVHPLHTHRCVAVIKSISPWSEPLIHFSILVIVVLIVMTASIPNIPPFLAWCMSACTAKKQYMRLTQVKSRRKLTWIKQLKQLGASNLGTIMCEMKIEIMTCKCKQSWWIWFKVKHAKNINTEQTTRSNSNKMIRLVVIVNVS